MNTLFAVGTGLTVVAFTLASSFLIAVVALLGGAVTMGMRMTAVNSLVLEQLPGIDNEDLWIRVRNNKGLVGWVWKSLTKTIGQEKPELPASQTTKKIQVTKKQGNPFGIKKVETTLDDVKASVAPVEKGRSYEVTIVYTGDATRGAHQGELVIDT